MPRPRPRARDRAPARRAPRNGARFPFAPAPEPPWTRPLAWLVAAAAVAAALAIALGPHRVGDYFTETDFYGGYADGARALQQGRLDPSRYAVVGPVYEMVLAAAGLVVRDLFLGGELVSWAAMAGTLLLWNALLFRRAGGSLALWSTAFLAANPTLLRYGYSATTDALATFFQAATLFAALALRGPRAPLAAGALAGLAALTRYNAIYLVPASLLGYLWLAPPADGRRARAAGLFLAGFAALALPWLALSLREGQPPGTQLFHNVAYDVFARSQGLTWDEYQARLQPQFRSWWDVIRRDPGAVAGRELHNVLDHLRLDLRLLLGWPAALVCGAGLACALADGTWRRLLPVWTAGALLFATLVPAFHAERYSLPLAPVYLTLAGAAAASPLLSHAVLGVPLKWLLLLWPLALSAQASVAHQARILGQLPVEVREVGAALRGASPQGGRVMARKPHIAYYAEMKAVPFPLVENLPELADSARSFGADFLYFSWPEAETRPSFWHLLDTSGVVPGLSVVKATVYHPAVAYRIGPEFGALPAWAGNDTLARYHAARARLMVNAADWRAHMLAGLVARSRNQFDQALEHFIAVTRLNPGFTQAWGLAGESQLNLGRLPEALDAYTRAAELDPANVDARVGLGWVHLRSRRPERAAGVWRPTIGQVVDRTTLLQMERLYRQLGDAQAAAAARARLAEVGP